MTSAADRRYALVRIAAGDYLLRSNDGGTLWRIHTYVENGSAEWQDEAGRWHAITGTWWAIEKSRHAPDALPDDFLDWGDEHWDYWESGYRTRRAALERVQSI